MEKKQKKQKQPQRPGCKTLELVPMGDYIMPRRYNSAATSYFLKAPADIMVPAHSVKAIKLNFGIRLPKDTTALILQSNETLGGIRGIGNTTRTRRRWLFFNRRERVVVDRSYNAHVQASIYDSGSSADSVEVHLLNLDDGFMIQKGTIIAQMMIVGVNTPFIFKREERPVEDIPLITTTTSGQRGRNAAPATEAENEKTEDNGSDGVAGSVPTEV